MSPEQRQLFDAALRLTAAERGELAARLLDSLDTTTDADADDRWSEVIAERISEIDSEAVTLVPWPELRARLLGRLNDSSAA